jgi:hypothetical protein
MNMYLWDKTDVRIAPELYLYCRLIHSQPERDGSLDNSIVVHEITHGITERMTGGGSGRCLQILESGGLGEGWSDTMAEYRCPIFSVIPLSLTQI